MLRKTRDSAKPGPLFKIFSNPTARVLDTAAKVGSTEQTISALSEATGLDYKTVKAVLYRLMRFNLVKKTRKIGNAQAFQMIEDRLNPLLKCAAELVTEPSEGDA